MKIEKKWFHELTANEIFEMYHLRVQVFVVEQNCSYQEIDDADLTALHVFIRDDQGRLEGYGRVFDAGAFNTFGRVLIRPEHRNNKRGTLLVETLMDTIHTTLKAKPIQIHAQAYLENFYGKFGFVRCTDVFLEDGIPHVEMIYKPKEK